MGKIVTKADKLAIEDAATDLTDRQRALVDNLFIPGITQEEAAVKAGYSPKSAHVEASRTLRKPKVIEYLDACVNHGIKANAVSAVMVVKDLSDQAKSPLVRLQAAQDILNRAGHAPDNKPVVNVGELTVNIDLS
jgi:hypothetical protein